MHPARAYLVYVFLDMLAISTIFVVYTLYLLHIGLTLSDVVVINAAFQVTILVAEIPTGMLADGRGRIWSIRMGVAIAGIGIFVYAFATGFWSAIIAEIIVGISAAFSSGAESAWITDALDRKGEKKRLKRIFADAMIVRKVAVVIGTGTGTLVASMWSFRASWILCGLLFVTTFLFTQVCMNGEDGEPLHRIPEREALRMSIRCLRRSYPLKWLLAILILFGFAFPFNHFWTPYFEPIVGLSGLYAINTFMQAAMFVGGMAIRRQAKAEEALDESDERVTDVDTKREATWVVVSFVLIGASLCAAGMLNGLAVLLVCVFIHEFGRGCEGPLCQTFMQRRVESSYRATYGSLESFFVQTGWSVIYFFLWLILRGSPVERETISHVWTLSGGLLTLLALFLWIIRPRRSS